MIDRLFGPRAAQRDVLSTQAYTPSQVVESSKLHNSEASELTVLFPPWHGGGWAFDRLRRRLTRRGQAVLAYNFHDEILKPNVPQVLAGYNVLEETITAELDTLADNYEATHFIGASLGNVALARVAQRWPRFASATLVTPGDSLARCVWEGIRTQHLRRALERQDWTEDTLEQAWQSLSPASCMKAFAGKAVRAVVSVSDEIIPAHSQMALLDELQAAGPDRLDVVPTPLGHLMAIGEYCLAPWRSKQLLPGLV